MNFRKILYPLLLIMLTLSLMANLYFYRQLHSIELHKNNLEADKEMVKEECELLKRDLDRSIANVKALKHPQNKAIQLSGNSPDFSNAAAVVFWNSLTKAVYVDAAQLPQQPGDKQYQLWAFSKGVYKSLGVFNRQPDKETLYRVANVEKPDGFAISLELPQGSETPSLICVSGKVDF